MKNLIKSILTSLALTIVNWLDKHTQHRAAMAHIQAQLVEALERTDTQGKALADTAGKVRALLLLTGAEECTTRWDEISRGEEVDDSVLRKWMQASTLAERMVQAQQAHEAVGFKNGTAQGLHQMRIKISVALQALGLFDIDWSKIPWDAHPENVMAGKGSNATITKAYAYIDQMYETLAMTAGKSMRLATHQAQYQSLQEKLGTTLTEWEQAMDERERQVHKSLLKVDALQFLLGIKLQDGANPANLEAWSSQWMSELSSEILSLEALVGVRAIFDEGKFRGHSYLAEGTEYDCENVDADDPSIMAMLTQLIQRPMPDFMKCDNCHKNLVVSPDGDTGYCIGCDDEWKRRD